jgi:hypothetical protein
MLESVFILLPRGEARSTGVNWTEIVPVAITQDAHSEHAIILVCECPKEGQSIAISTEIIVDKLPHPFLKLESIVQSATRPVGTQTKQRASASRPMSSFDPIIEETPAAREILIRLDAGIAHSYQKALAREFVQLHLASLVIQTQDC